MKYSLRQAGGACASSALLAALLMLPACGSGDNDPGPGGVTVGEARALDEAAEMLDEERLPADALPPEGEAPPQEPAEAPPAG